MNNNEQSTPWRTGNPPRSGWYIVTSKYRNPKGKEVTDSSPMEWREKGWLEPEEFTSWKQTEAVILAWMPLPEPYRGMGDLLVAAWSADLVGVNRGGKLHFVVRSEATQEEQERWDILLDRIITTPNR